MPPALNASQPASGSSADRAQIATSNQTLNAFLGRSRPAWMTDTPNPKPSVTTSSHGAVQSQVQATQTKRGRPRKYPPPKPTQPQQPTFTPTRTILPSPTPTNAPSPAVPGNASSPQWSNAGLTGQRPASSSPHVSLAPTTSINRNHPSAGADFLSQMGTNSPGSVQDQIASIPSSNGVPSTVSDTQSWQDTNSSTHGSSAYQEERPGKRPRLAASSGATANGDVPFVEAVMNGWLRLIDQRIENCGGVQRLDRSVERPRFLMLRDACEKRDPFYVLLHQQFCLWSINKAAVHAALGLEPAVIDSAFEQLLLVLRKNREMAQHNLDWLSQFPGPFAATSQLFSSNPVKDQIVRFLVHFSSSWNQLISHVESRRYPLMAYEGEQFLGCTSRTLQPVFFTLTRRRLGIDDGPLTTELNALFSKDQENELRMARGRVSPDAMMVARGDIAAAYTSIIAKGRRQSIEQAAAAASGAMPRPMVAQQPQGNSRTTSAQVVSPQFVVQNSGNEQMPQVQSPGLGQMATPTSGNGVVQRRPALNVAAIAHHSPVPVQTYPQGANPPGWTNAQQSPTGSFQATPVQGRTGWAWNQSPTGSNNPPIQFKQVAPNATGFPSTSRTQLLSSRTASPSGFSQAPQPRHNAVPQPRRTSSSGSRHGTPRASPMQSPRQPKRPHGPLSIPRIPANEYPTNPYDWSSVRPSLHLVHLRSPRRVAVIPTQTRYYQYVASFPVSPRVLPPQAGPRSITFSISDYIHSRLSLQSTSDSLPISRYFEGSLRYRFRMCARSQKGSVIKETEWAALASHWPEFMHAMFNGVPVCLRRKQHFHHDLPVELTDALVVGENTVKISLPDVAANVKKGLTYFIAVELITTASHDAVKQRIMNTQPLAAEETKREVQRRLKPLDVDDIVVENDVLCITVADPFSFTMFEVPVRGVDCKHLECFDLDTWLQSRPKKPKAAAEPSLVDAWKCPICNKDARPVSLRIDGFFVEVRNKLVEQGKEGTKRINISADGRWTAVDESEDSEDESPIARKRSPERTSRRVSHTTASETIEILDD